MIQELGRRIKLLFGTGTATRVETGSVQIKMATGATNDKIKRVHNYGFNSRPLTQSKAYTLFIGGDVSRGIAVLIEDQRHEMELQPGEVAMLDDKGNLIHFTAAGIQITTLQSINIQAAKDVNVTCQNATIDATKTTINSATDINGAVTITGAVDITGAVGLNGAVTNNGGISIDGKDFGTHDHTEHDGYSTSDPN